MHSRTDIKRGLLIHKKLQSTNLCHIYPPLKIGRCRARCRIPFSLWHHVPLSVYASSARIPVTAIIP